ncbi:MAG TPA: P-loop NTPase fold protein [Chloroflexia bacterium]|nr:P-loop NTPase fold protein [Chloroflexia bacterium]
MGLPQNSQWSADQPLTDPKKDRLGYAPYAQKLAQSITKQTPPHGLVIAIYGSWGAGKSTLLEFVEQYLQQETDENQPVIVRFNPWWFSGQEDLTRSFFSQLKSTLARKWKSVGKEFLDRLGQFADVVSDAPLPESVAWFPKLVARLSKRERGDVSALKEQISATLRLSNKRILVIIDDIDRLTSDEIRQLFRLVKAVANFPNVVYLLAFDRDVVTEALGGLQGARGADYLDKIIQVPIQLPSLGQEQLGRLCAEHLTELLGDISPDLLDQGRWNLTFPPITKFLKTPRDVARLMNALAFTYPVVHAEVNPIDFVAIESLRLFCPTVYDAIRQHPDMFAGTAPNSYSGSRSTPDLSTQREFYDTLISEAQVADPKALQRLLRNLFPKLDAVWTNTHYGSEWEHRWRRELRVASRSKFEIYFRMAVPSDSISNMEMRAILALANNTDQLSAKLLELGKQQGVDGTTRLRIFLSYVGDYVEQHIPHENTAIIVTALLQVGDQLLLSDKGAGVRSLSLNTILYRVVTGLLDRLPLPSRVTVLNGAMEQSPAIATIVQLAEALGAEHGKYGGTVAPEPLITLAEWEELDRLVVARIQDAAQGGYLLESPNLGRTLRFWREHVGEQPVRHWVQSSTEDVHRLLAFLDCFVDTRRLLSLTDATTHVRQSMDLESLTPFLDADALHARLQQITSDGTLDENEVEVIRQFEIGYAKRQQGIDPHEPFEPGASEQGTERIASDS